MLTQSILAHTVAKSDRAGSQDAHADSPHIDAFAVADGVSSRSFMSGHFAVRLADSFVTHPEEHLDRMLFGARPSGNIGTVADRSAAMSDTRATFDAWLARAQQAWLEEVAAVHLPRADPLARAKWETGELESCATFAGVRVRAAAEDRFEIGLLVVGDCYVFVADAGEAQRFTMDGRRAGEGGATECVRIGSAGRGEELVPYKRKLVTARPGAYVLLATDGLGRWLSDETDAGHIKELLENLRSLRTRSEFTRFVLELRASGALGSDAPDDATLVMFRLMSPRDASADGALRVLTGLAEHDATIYQRLKRIGPRGTLTFHAPLPTGDGAVHRNS